MNKLITYFNSLFIYREIQFIEFIYFLIKHTLELIYIGK